MQRNWFDTIGDAYARYRPDYPAELAAFLAGLAPDRRVAVDVGCGNGQFTRHLAAHFESVLGFDASADQISHAVRHARLHYACAPAEALPAGDAVAGLITAAQAAHWFDLPKFYREVERIAAKGAVIALITYGAPQFDAELNGRFQQFYSGEIGPYWPAERAMVDSGYAGLAFPFAEIATPALAIARDWNWQALIGYLSTWSAMRRLEQAGRMDIAEGFLIEFQALWGDPQIRRPVRFPIRMRLGRVSA